MNERIRECMYNAGLNSNYVEGFNSIYSKQLEKFAKLIIEECISICDRRGEVLQKDLDERGKDMADKPYFFVEGAISASFRNAQSIRQHFGVEE